ncbi:ATP-binding protein [Nonomuraea sp. MCN248]|uniref:ATP-binding protein n=1 Tax=Nonomuraea corallina TaxID=2989783 RepID=A0ABT4SDQ1_9ACTN|nr:ATP-binding protein [Nonomuraea corallina]MDA0635066.1 ATP-binding protein [Nonomuraea corallina]
MPDITTSAVAPTRLRIPRQRGQAPGTSPSGPILREHIDAMIDLHPGGLTWRRTFPGTLDHIPHARHFTRYLLADSDHRHDAELIAGELSANAVRHTASGRPHGTFIVEINRTTTTITIAVYDCGWGGVPRFGRLFGIDAEYGRGLTIVAALADQVGYEGAEEVGHRVWARMVQPSG